MSRLKVLHVITGLANGGAEGVLFRLAAATRERVEHAVVSLRDDGVYGERLRDLGIPVGALGMQTPAGAVLGLPRLWREVRRMRPDVVQTWMYHADLVGGGAARLAGCRNVVWGIRHSTLDGEKRTTRWVAKVCACLSGGIPRAIVCNSEVAVRLHQEMGYRADRFRIIFNGVDLARFRPDPEARRRMRAAWGAASDETLIGMVGRWHRLKDHGTWLAALRILREQGGTWRGVLVGPGMDGGNEGLRALIESNGLADHVVLAGALDDIPAVMNALDLHVLSSGGGEAFPNVVAEAMACGTPCVVTEVGDAGRIVGDAGWRVPPRRPDRLAEAIREAQRALQAEGWERLGARCRERMEAHFGLERMVEGFLDVWQGMMDPKGTLP